MIDYNFYTLIFRYPQLDYDPFYKKVLKEINSADGNGIDFLWDRIITTSKDSFPSEISNTLDSMKTDVLFSLYASTCYTTDHGIPRDKIMSLLQDLDPALKY